MIRYVSLLVAVPAMFAAAPSQPMVDRGVNDVARESSLHPYQPTNCAKCVSCNPSPGEAGHVVYLHDDGARDGSTAHSCLTWGTDACSVHGDCGDSFRQASEQPKSTDVDELFGNPARFAAAFMRKYPEFTSVNVERGALQIRGCEDDVIVGHVELPMGVAIELSATTLALVN